MIKVKPVDLKGSSKYGVTFWYRMDLDASLLKAVFTTVWFGLGIKNNA